MTPLSDLLFLNGSKYQAYAPAPAPVYSGWRLLHMAEGGDPHAISKPAVHNSESIASVPFTRTMQLLSFYINSRTNMNFTGAKWRGVYGNTTAFTNGNGFGDSSDPRVDYVNGLDVGADEPKLMRGIICSGSFFRGNVEGEYLTLYPGVHGIDVNQPIGYDETFIKKVLDNNWYFYAVSADLQAASHFAQGAGMPVIVPLFLKVPTKYPRSWFTRWESNDLPNPTSFYLRK